MPNFAALRAAVFPLSTKNLRGGGYPPPPVGARVNYEVYRGRGNNDQCENNNHSNALMSCNYT